MKISQTIPNIEYLSTECRPDENPEQQPGRLALPIVECRKLKEDSYKAEFRMILSGVTNRTLENTSERHGNKSWVDDSIRALFANLSDDQELDFNYSWQDRNGRFRFGMEVVGISNGVSSMDALKGAEDLLASLKVTLGAPVYGLKFAPGRVDYSHKKNSKSTYLLKPSTI